MTRKWAWQRMAAMLLALLGAACPGAVHADSAKPIRSIDLPLNQTRVVHLRHAPKRISVGNQAIADIMMMRANQVYVVARALGSTNVVLWDGNDRVIDTFKVEVTYDLDTLKRKLHELLPDESIAVYASQGAVVLSGEVSSAAKMQMALDLANSLLGTEGNKQQQKGGRVINMMQVGGAQQVLLEVKVAEISRSFIRKMGIKFNGVSTDGHISFGTLTTGGALTSSIFNGGGATIPADASQVLTGFSDVAQDRGLIASYLDGTTLANVVIDAAKEEGLAKVLAEPTLTTLTGQQATFLAGGEFPVPVPGQYGEVKVDFKEFGIGLKFLPVVLDSGVINLNVDISVSELSTDNALTVTVPGASAAYFVPSLTKRGAHSSVELANGQTMGIAGLINENLRERVNKFPGLGDIPILGALFRSQDFVKGQTELVIFVTPHYAKPMDSSLVRLPTDSFVEPSSTEFYLLGQLQHGGGDDEKTLPSNKGGIEGRFGHDL